MRLRVLGAILQGLLQRRDRRICVALVELGGSWSQAGGSYQATVADSSASSLLLFNTADLQARIIEIANRVFAPTEEEVSQAQAAVAAVAEAEAKGEGAANYAEVRAK